MKGKKLVLSARADGFGERMLSILNAMYISERYALPFGYIWLDFSQISCNDEENGILMSQANLSSEHVIFNEEFIKKYSYSKKYNFIPYDGIGLFLKNEKYSLDNVMNNTPPYEWGYLSTQYDLSEICMDIDKNEYYGKLVDIWNNIGFSKEIHSVIKRANDYSENNNFVALHIRTGDIVFKDRFHFLYEGREKALCLHLAIEIIKLELMKNSQILIFTDDIKNVKKLVQFIIGEFRNIEAKKHIIFVDDLMEQMHLFGVKRILFEITLMSNARKIYASGKSGFSNLASRIKNTTEIISVYKMFSIFEKFQIINDYIEKIGDIHSYHKSFSYFHLFMLSNKLNLQCYQQRVYLTKAMKYDPENLIYNFCYIYILSKEKKYDKIEQILYTLLFSRNDFFKYMLNVSPYDCKFMYSFVFKELIRYASFRYPLSLYVVYRFILEMKNYHHLGIRCKTIYEMKFVENKIAYFDKFSEVFSNFFKILEIKCNIIYGAADRVKNQLAYKIGSAILSSRTFFKIIKLPFELAKIYCNHKNEKIIYEKMVKIDNSLKLPLLEQYVDYSEAEKIKNHLSYRIGYVVIKHPFSFIFRVFKIYKEWKNERKKIQ